MLNSFEILLLFREKAAVYNFCPSFKDLHAIVQTVISCRIVRSMLYFFREREDDLSATTLPFFSIFMHMNRKRGLMNSYQIKSQENGLLVSGLRDFSLPQILDCGQCFRWTPVDGDETHWQGFAMGRKLSIEQQGENCFFFSPCSIEEFKQIWTPYFDLDCDYTAIKRALCCDPIMREATGYAPGIRVLKQDGWETLCTFIISQNNNIKRIRGIVERFCQLFGEERNGGFDFPTPQRLASATLEDLAPLRAGFRAKYLLDAAQKVASAEVDLSLIPQLPYEEASALLQKIHGVGPKVADCTLLFGFYRLEAFPLDVWMKRAMKTLYPQGLPSEILPYRGIAQQYLFHYSRMHPELFE